jgi:hypothetical protein
MTLTYYKMISPCCNGRPGREGKAMRGSNPGPRACEI